MMKNLHFWVSGILLLIWFLGYMILDVSWEIHFVFLLAVVVLIIKLIKEYHSEK